MRIAKFISNSGYCSRRNAEQIILDKRVSINDKIVTELHLQVSENDTVKIDNAEISIEAPRMWLYHKPAGLVTTHSDPEGRKTVFETLPKSLPRIISIGRLDLNSEGLLLLTNHGDIARYFELPKNNFQRIYKVRAYGHTTLAALQSTKRILDQDGLYLKWEKIERLNGEGKNAWYQISLTQGKNREVRRIFEHFGLQVNRLIRLNYGPFKLGKLKIGEVKEIEKSQLDLILKQIRND